ncbi:MAG: hypothetical protein AAF677_17885 [Pseudomonadota bacterium]
MAWIEIKAADGITQRGAAMVNTQHVAMISVPAPDEPPGIFLRFINGEEAFLRCTSAAAQDALYAKLKGSL